MDMLPFFEEYEHELNLQYLQKYDRQWKFRCPICGDSETDETATRGDIFFDWQNEGVFKCMRCGVSLGTKSFIREVAPQLITEYNKQKFKYKLDDDYDYGVQETDEIEKVEVETIEEFEFKTQKELGFTKIETDQTGIIEYLDSRGLDKKDFLYDIKTDRLVIPYFNKDYDIYYYQLRALQKDVKNKYMFDKSRQINEGFIHRNIFNAFHIDVTKPIQLLEGAIDSLLVENAVGNSGIGNIELNIDFINEYFKIPKDNIYCILDFDNAGFDMTIKLSHNYYVFDWIKYFKEKELDYLVDLEKVDINQLYLDLKRSTKFTFEELEPFYVKYSKRLEHQYTNLAKKFSSKIKRERELFKE